MSSKSGGDALSYDKGVVCIIPAFNEEKTVASVAEVVARSELVKRVIVVDDGSNDSTSRMASTVEGVQVIRHETNLGKGAAMDTGLKASDEEVVLFIDADLIGLKPQHLAQLLLPVLAGEADMTVGIFRGGRLSTDLAHKVAPSLSGQRAVKRSVIEGLDLNSVGFGVERALTDLWEEGRIVVKKVILEGVTHLMKEEKRGYWEGFKQRMGMYLDILRYECCALWRKIGLAKRGRG